MANQGIARKDTAALTIPGPTCSRFFYHGIHGFHVGFNMKSSMKIDKHWDFTMRIPGKIEIQASSSKNGKINQQNENNREGAGHNSWTKEATKFGQAWAPVKKRWLKGPKLDHSVEVSVSSWWYPKIIQSSWMNIEM
jgi:hypothetical protein